MAEEVLEEEQDEEEYRKQLKKFFKGEDEDNT